MQLQHNSKLKKHLARVLSIAIAVAIAFTSLPASTLTVHADVGDTGENTGGGAGGMSGSTSALAWSQNHQGYRIYVINQDFVRISPVYDFTYSEPYAGTWEYSTRFDGPNSPTTPYYDDIDKLQEWCDSEFEVPTPTKLSNGNRIGNGQEFKEWFFAGRAGTSIPGGGTGTGNGSGNNNTGTSQNYDNTVLVSKLTMDYSEFNEDRIWYHETAQNYTASGIEYGVNNRISVADWYLGLEYYNEMCAVRDDWYTIYSSDIGKWFDINGDGVGDYQLTAYALKHYCSYLGYIESFYFEDANHPEMITLGCYIYILGKEAVLRSSMDILDDDWNRVNDQLLYYSPVSNQSLLTQSIPLAGGTGGGAGMPAYNLINKDNTIQVPGYANAALALADGCYLVVEPITWLYVRTNPTGNWQSTSTYESTRTYGTYWNLASKWVGTGGFYSSVMTKLFNNCLAISRTVTSPTGKTLQGIESTSTKSVADSLNYMNSGYGLSMHIYDSSMFDATTSTYDEPLGSTPGKAPDDSDQLPEADRTNTAKYANIVKFYEDTNTTTGVTARSSFTRNPSPKTIF